jgi:AraC-like DNA-binding protein
MIKNNKISKIGFSKIGGIFIGKDIISDFHKHYALTVILSFGEPFTLHTLEGLGGNFHFALIQKNIDFSVETESHIAFIHLVPYSPEGIRLTDCSQPIKILDRLQSQQCLSLIKDWYYSELNHQETVEGILRSISLIPELCCEQQQLDKRILRALQLVMESEDEKLPVESISKMAHLSVSHFNRLFKKETGLTFRRFVLHSKLIKSIFAIHENSSLTKASFIGGFSDQPHLTRTFKENFGIKPSQLLK